MYINVCVMDIEYVVQVIVIISECWEYIPMLWIFKFDNNREQKSHDGSSGGFQYEVLNTMFLST